MDRKQKFEKKKQKLKNEVLARKQASSGNSQSKFSSSQILQKAEELMESFEFELALTFCRKALDMEPNNVKALELHGSLNLQLGKPTEAYESYSKAAELLPHEGHSKYMCLGQLSCGSEAINYYKKGIEIIKKELLISGDEATNAEKEPPKPTDLSNAYLSVAEIYLTDECFEENAGNLCKEYLDSALAADEKNAEVYHLYASYCISEEDKESAIEYMSKGIDMWLPQLKGVEKENSTAPDSGAYMCPISYSGRVNCSKLLIELEEYETASDILEYLLDEDDEVVEVWYLLGWLNYLRGAEFKGNVDGYMEKGIELAEKIKYEDKDMVEHMREILQEVSQGVDGEDEEMMEEENDEDDSSSEEMS